MLIIMCSIIGFILIFLGILTQLYLTDYLKASHKHKEDALDTILNFHFSSGTVESNIEKTKPINYDILTQAISHQNTPSMTKIDADHDSLLFDIDEENKIFQKECLHLSHQEKLRNEIIRFDNRMKNI